MPCETRFAFCESSYQILGNKVLLNFETKRYLGKWDQFTLKADKEDHTYIKPSDALTFKMGDGEVRPEVSALAMYLLASA